jgi:hypothetical protein
LQIERLRAYRDNRLYPTNHRIFGRVPVFVDGDGVFCAVGYLMGNSGWNRTVLRVAESDNHVRIESLTSGPVFGWVLTSGLLLEEAALIQPEYSSLEDPNDSRRWEENDRLWQHFAMVELMLVADTERSLDEAVERLRRAAPPGITPQQVASGEPPEPGRD